ncbi:hypothetical protein [Serratia quinivorans]|uniref:hypothetical protein n=1 Tax=Serratia quinivorans TaxID=137545 RepID=UPI00107E980C|nr:hypothetical protein [Serratia quinivorans]QBX68702.1 hypothetical protein E4343_22150 [Serratia quinivorans]
MKQKSLRDVMDSQLQVTIAEDGYELSNSAGIARYDKWGYRTTVSGTPEYFPVSISVKGSAQQAKAHMGEFIDTGAMSEHARKSVGDIVVNVSVDTKPISEAVKELEQAHAQWEKTRDKIFEQVAHDVLKCAINNLITKAIAQWDTNPSVKR